MFTGVIHHCGRVGNVFTSREFMKYEVICTELIESYIAYQGASVAVNGVCQTITEIGTNSFTFEAVFSSLKKTTLGLLKRGMSVHLEPAMRMHDVINGHIIQGHVSHVARIRAIRKINKAFEFIFKCDTKGIHQDDSVCIDGISLTVAYVDAKSFSVAIIPETFQRTNFKDYSVGDYVNIEKNFLSRSSHDSISRPQWAHKLSSWGYGA